MVSKKPVTVRADDCIWDKIKIIADKEKRSINSQIEYLLEKGILEYESQHGEIKLPEE